MRLADIAAAVETHGTVTTAAGETWTWIRYPNFRVSPVAHAWRYASSRGKLMSRDLRVLQASSHPQKQKQYCRTSLPVNVDNAGLGGTAPVLLHRVIAFTFLGDPPAPNFTVDHVDRCRANNAVANLRWASPADQLDNRTRRTIYLTDGVHATTTRRALSDVVKLGRDDGDHDDGTTTSCSSVIKTAQHGDIVQVGGNTMQVVVKETKMQAPRGPVHTLGRPKSRTLSKKARVFAQFLQGMDVDAVCAAHNISRSTALSYIGQACRESSPTTVRRLATDRLGLDSIETRERLGLHIRNLNARIANHNMSQAEYLDAYQRVVADLVPCLGHDWPVLKQVFNSIACSFRTP
jgi:hypothetical protein